VWEYEVISDAGDVPAMTELGQPTIETPARRGDTFFVTFPVGYSHNPTPYEPAVGQRCRVVRTQNGRGQECGGAVERVTPVVRVRLDGAGWQ
jgi:hypothetical protein